MHTPTREEVTARALRAYRESREDTVCHLSTVSCAEAALADDRKALKEAVEHEHEAWAKYVALRDGEV